MTTHFPKNRGKRSVQEKNDLNIRGLEPAVIDFFPFLRRIGDDSNGGAVNCGDFTWKALVSLMNKSKSNPTVWGCFFWSLVNITSWLFSRAMGNAVFCLHFPVFFSINRTCAFSLNRYIVFVFGVTYKKRNWNLPPASWIFDTESIHWYTYPFFQFWGQIVTKSVFLFPYH